MRMSMIKHLFLLSYIASFSFAANHEQIQKDPQIVVEPDQTDIFAIP